MRILEATDEKGKYAWRMATFVGDVVSENLEAQKDPRNGFSRTRQGAAARRIASIPSTVFADWQREHRSHGGTVGDADWQLFLRGKIAAHPQYRTVDQLLHVTPNAGSVLVK